MDDDDDQIDGLSPTSMWRRNRRRKDFSDDEDYKFGNEEDYKSNKEEDYESDEEGQYKPEKKEDHKPVINIGSPSATPPAPVPVSVVRVNVSLRNKRRGAFISTGGKVPRHALANRYPAANLCDRDPPGDWDHKIPKTSVQRPEWKPNRQTQEEGLMKELSGAASKFEQAYNSMMKIIGDLEDHYEEKKWKKEEK
jgi:hypothetical protein